MKLKTLYEKLYDKIFSVKFFRMFLKIPGVEKQRILSRQMLKNWQ